MTARNMVNHRFKEKILAGVPMVSTFVKTPHPLVVEILGRSGLDSIVLDAEHAGFDRASIDLALIAARSVDLPVIVRIPDMSWALAVLDMGAAGLMVPHVTTAAQAAEVVQATRFVPGGRGFAGSTRAAEFTKRSMAEYHANAADGITLMCQIEDPEGYQNFQEIAAVDGVDTLFVGRADLAVSHGIIDFFAPGLGEKRGLRPVSF